MRVSLDTNILHQEGYTSQSMRLLHRLVAAGSIQIVISRMVIREYDTKRLAEISSKLQGAKDNLKDINKIFTKASKNISMLDALDSQLSNFFPELESYLKETTQKWLSDFNVSVIDIAPECYENVWDDYFSGNGCFKKPKNRDDIPDAVISRSLENLVGDGKPLAFICKDGQLKAHLGKNANVQVFGELSELIRSPDFEKKLHALDAQDKVIEEFKTVIGSDDFLRDVIKYFSSPESDFFYAYWEDDQIENQGSLPLSVFGGVSAGSLVISSIEQEKFAPVACIDPGHYVIPVSFRADIPISFVGDYGEWLHASDEIKREVGVDSANGDGACEFSVLRNATITGEIVVHLLKKENPQSLLVHAKYIGTDESPLDVEFVPGKIIL